jgi:hypothetical protein
MPEETKPREKQKQRQKSEWFAGERDLDRYHLIMMDIDRSIFEVKKRNVDAVRNCYAALDTFYSTCIRPFLSKIEMDKWDKIFTWARSMAFNDPRKIDYRIFTVLENLHKDMMLIRHTLNLGLPHTSKISVKTKLQRGLGLNGDAEDGDS